MADEWSDTTLGALTDWMSGGTPSKVVQRYWNGRIPWISASSMKSISLCDSELKITEEGLRSGSRLAEKDTVLLLVRGSELHKRIPIGIATKQVAFNQDVKALRPRDGLSPKYLLYWLLGNAAGLLRKVEHTGIGAGKLDTDVLKSLPFSLPSITDQRAIVNIVGTLDDKIELNRRMNETLEAMARALFKSWFVDFDPVHAKAEGRDPGLPKPLADLFPDSFEDTDLGETPEGWEVKSLNEIADFLNGLALQKYPAGDGPTLPVVKITQLRKGDTEGAEQCNANLPSEYVIDDGDVLFSWSGSLECVLWTGGKGALNQHLFNVTSTKVPKWFYYFCVHQHLSDFRNIAAGKATTMGHIQRHHLTDAKVTVPGPSVFKVVGKVMAPIIEQILIRRLESRTLTSLRELLLPKLISGELRVKDKKKFIERAVS